MRSNWPDAHATLVLSRSGSTRTAIRTASAQKLAYIYYGEEPGRRSTAKMLTKDEVQRIALIAHACVLPDAGPASAQAVVTR